MLDYPVRFPGTNMTLPWTQTGMSAAVVLVALLVVGLTCCGAAALVVVACCGGRRRDVVGESGDARWLPGVGVIDYVPTSNRSSVRVSLILPESTPGDGPASPVDSPRAAPPEELLTPEGSATVSSYLSPSADAPRLSRASSQNTSEGLPSPSPFSDLPPDAATGSAPPTHPITTWLSITTEIRKTSSLAPKPACKALDAAAQVARDTTQESLASDVLSSVDVSSLVSPLSPLVEPSNSADAEATEVCLAEAAPSVNTRPSMPERPPADTSPSCQSSTSRDLLDMTPPRDARGTPDMPSAVKRKWKPQTVPS